MILTWKILNNKKGLVSSPFIFVLNLPFLLTYSRFGDKISVKINEMSEEMKLKLGNVIGGGEKSYQKLAEYGYQCADFQLANTESFWYTCSADEFEKGLKREKAWADENGIEIHQAHGPWDKLDIELSQDFSYEKFRNLLEIRKRSISACPYLGCKNWVIHPIFPYTSDDTLKGMEEETYKRNVEFYSELVETAREYDVTICFENMPHVRFSLAEVDKIKLVIDEIGDEHFKACLDTGHVNCFTTRNLGDAVRVLGKDLRVLHVHDNKVVRDSHEFPYFGTADWDSFYEGLVDVGYNGVFNLETTPSWKLEPGLYDDMAKCLVRIAKQIIHYDE